jgi:hypothetical protein
MGDLGLCVVAVAGAPDSDPPPGLALPLPGCDVRLIATPGDLVTQAADAEVVFIWEPRPDWREWVHRDTRRLAGREVIVVGAGGIGRGITRLIRSAGASARCVGRHSRRDPEVGQVAVSRTGRACCRTLISSFSLCRSPRRPTAFSARRNSR